MMIYTRSERTTNGTINQAALEIIAGMKPIWIRSIQIMIGAATASVFGIGRPAAAGITPTTPVGLLGMGPLGDRSLAKTALAWGTSPTAPTDYYARANMPATLGAFWGWPNIFPQEGRMKIQVNAGASFVIFNITANAVADVNLEIEE